MNDDPTLIMWTVSQIAERDGLSKAAVSKTITKLLEEKPDTPVDRDNRGRVSLVSLVHYDIHRERFLNPAKAKSRAAPQTVGASESFEEARRQSEWLKVHRERVRHQEDVGDLIRKDHLGLALREAGSEVQAIIKRLPNRADEVAVAVSKEGVHGVRTLLRQIAFDIGNEIADRLLGVSQASPKHDPLIPGSEG